VSEDALRRLLERLNSEPGFRDRLQEDWERAVEEFDLSPSEFVALATGDEDALRRLSGAEVAAHAGAVGEVAIRTLVSCYWCPAPAPPRNNCTGVWTGCLEGGHGGFGPRRMG
jgi:hypothetical protein